MTLIEASQKGIDKVRKAIWANPEAYMKIDIVDGKLGPWGHLYDQPTQDALGVESPQNTLIIGDRQDDWIKFTPQQVIEAEQV